MLGKLKNDPWGSFENFINDSDVEKFVGKNFNKYKETWTKIYEKNNSHKRMKNKAWHEKTFGMSFSWLAFLLWFSWFGYRKMFKGFILTSAILFSVLIFEIISGIDLGTGPYTAAFLSIAIYAKSIYLDHTIKKLAEIKSMAPQDKEFFIHKHGGTSLLNLFAYTIYFLGSFSLFLFITYQIALATGIGANFWDLN